MINTTEQIIAQNLTDLRKSKNLKQSELSDAIGYSDKTISRWENGTSVPDISTLIKLANFYGVSLEDLVNENVLSKYSEETKKHNQQVLVNRYFMLALAVLSVWLLAAITYVGLIWIKEIDLWQIFIMAVPVSSLLVFRSTRKDRSLKWLNFAMLSLTICATLLFVYLIYLEYNFWVLFVLMAPLEGIVAISTLFPTKVKFSINRKKHND